MRIIIRTPNWLGDAVFNLPFINKVAELNEVTAVTKENLKELFYQFKVITFETNSELFCKHLKLRNEYDYYLVLPISFSSAMASFLSGTPNRVGFSFDLRDFLLTKRVKIPPDWKQKHTTLTYGLLYEDLINPKEVSFKMEIPDEFINQGIQTLKAFQLDKTPYVTVAPFAQFGTAKEWGEENLIKLSSLLSSSGIKMVILGSKKDIERSKVIQNKNIVNLVGETSLWEAAFIAKNGIAFVGGDSGLTHLAALTGANTIALFGPTPVEWTKPIGEKVRVLSTKLHCTPCEKRECPLKTKECMKRIEPESVFEFIRG